MLTGIRFWAATLATILMISATSLSANEVKTYTYDALGRLVLVERSGMVNDGQTAATAFDAAGNRVSYSTTGTASAPTLSISDASATEGSNLVFTVTRSAITSTAVSVAYATSNGSAASGSDYTASSGTLSFTAGQTSKTITISTSDDSAVESAETMTVTLSSATVSGSGGVTTIDRAASVRSPTMARGTARARSPIHRPRTLYLMAGT